MIIGAEVIGGSILGVGGFSLADYVLDREIFVVVHFVPMFITVMKHPRSDLVIGVIGNARSVGR